uniref:hypothetical protein n=1 Tax=Ruminococcus bicirculans (ex Wegman et al. 2014) TaxID=1160721 RepID=UPI003FEF966B
DVYKRQPMQYAVNVIWLGFAMLGLLSAKFPITISRMKKFYGALNFLRNANRLLLSENAIILA